MNKIKVIIKRPDEVKGHVTSVSNTLENLQTHVDGLIEVVRGGPNWAIICNEEGKIHRMEPNCYCLGELFVGNILVVGVDKDEFCDVPGSVLMMWKMGVLFQPYKGGPAW